LKNDPIQLDNSKSTDMGWSVSMEEKMQKRRGFIGRGEIK
jgi:hypothetical protein